MKSVITISWRSGECNLVVDEFFPTTMEKTRKIFKLLIADPAWSDYEVNELLDYFKERKRNELKQAKEARHMARGILESAELIKKRCSRMSEEYQEYMRLRDKAINLGAESRKHLIAANYCTRAYTLLCDMWGGKQA